MLADKIIDTDILIIGSEGAGARAAIEAAKHNVSVTIVTKGPLGKSGATVTAGTDIDVDSKSIINVLGLKGWPGKRRPDPHDSKEIFFKDMIVEGRFINNQRLVAKHCEDAPIRVKELIDWGMAIRQEIGHAQGHTYPRGILSTGKEVLKALFRKLREFQDKIEVFEDIMIVDLLIKDDKCVGAAGISIRDGIFILFRARATILATGGGLRIYPYTSGPEELTGDGQSMAYRAGVELIDYQQVQFITHTLYRSPITTNTLNPILGTGYMWLLNNKGERLMKRYDPRTMERSTRDLIGIGIMNEIWEGRGWEDERGAWVMASCRHMPKNMVDELKRISSYYSDEFIDVLKNNAVPAFPVSHFFCGGIRINEFCETNVPGLLAAGEVAGGVMGSNRLSGNAVSMIVIQGKWAGLQAAAYASHASAPQIDLKQVDEIRKRIFKSLDRKEGCNPIELRKKIQKMAYSNVGPVRTEARLEMAIQEIQKIRKKEASQLYCSNKSPVLNREWVNTLEIYNMLDSLELIAKSALYRKESRGNHYRADYPQADNENWLCNVIVKQVRGKPKLWTEPIVTIDRWNGKTMLDDLPEKMPPSTWFVPEAGGRWI